MSHEQRGATEQGPNVLAMQLESLRAVFAAYSSNDASSSEVCSVLRAIDISALLKIVQSPRSETAGPQRYLIFNRDVQQWWRAPDHGMTDKKECAHAYTKEEAEKAMEFDLSAKNCDLQALRSAIVGSQINAAPQDVAGVKARCDIDAQHPAVAAPLSQSDKPWSATKELMDTPGFDPMTKVGHLAMKYAEMVDLASRSSVAANDRDILMRFQKWTILLDPKGAAEFWDDIDWLRNTRLSATAVHPDTARLDFIERMGRNSNWVARHSNTGRGYRLHNDKDGIALSARAAIDMEMKKLREYVPEGKS